MKKTCGKKAISLLLAVLMIMGIFPVGSFASESSNKRIIQIYSENLESQKEVPLGTSLEELGLPSELSIQVERTAEESEPTIVDEMATINWEGAYIPEQPGEYKLTAAFADNGYNYYGEMPSVSVRITEQKAARTMPLNTGDVAGEEINLVDINAITTSKFEVKPKGDTEYHELPLPEGTAVYVGDEVHIVFNYTTIENASSNNIYYFSIPEGLNAIATVSRGDIMDDGQIVGRYWVEDGKVKLQFNESYLNDNGNTIDAGSVNFYATLDESAVDNNGIIKLGDTEIGRVPVQRDPEVTNATVKKWNGDGTVDGSGLVYDAEKGAVQYTFEVTADGKNNKTIDSIDVTDTLTTTINGAEDTSVVTGDYTDITITPAGSAIFTKQNGKYVLHAENVAPGTIIKVSYWVPVKDGIVQANFTNDVDAMKKVGGTESVAGSDSVQGKINNTLQINKDAENPVYHVDEDAKTTTVTYKVRVTAPASNTTDIANAYVEDIYELGGDLVTGISGFSTTSENVSYNNDFETGAKPKFTVELGTMKPGETKEFTYTAVLDTDKCYMQNSNSDRWLDNYAYAKSGDFTFDKSKGSRSFKKEFTKKTGIYDPISGAYKFTVVFNGVLPDTPENADLTDPKYYYNGVLDFLDDEIQTKGKGFHYVGTPAPILEAYRGPEGSDALLTAQLDGNSIDGQESFHLAVPQNMKGAYSYRLTYYVNIPADAQQTDVVKNQYSVTLKGVGNGGSDQTFNSSASVSSAAAGSNALNKSLSNEVGDRQVLETETGHESEYATQMYTVKISSPIVANATLEDTVTDGDIFGIDFPSDYLQQNLVIKQGNKVFVNGTDYKLESIDNKSFKVTFLKEVTDASTTNPVTVTYKGQLKVTDAGKEFAETPNNVNNLNPSAIKNSATLNNGNLGPVTKSVDLEPTGKIVKKAANAQELGGAGNELAWDIKPSFNWVYCAFGLGYHNLVDTIPADQELVKVEHFTDNNTPQLCPEGTGNDHGYDVVENADGTTTVTIKASAGVCNHHETYRIWTRIKASALSDQGINPDDFDNYTFTNSAYYEANGAQWAVAADQTVSNHRFSKETEYGAGTEALGGVKFTLKINTDGAVLNESGDTITVHDEMNPQLVLKADTLRINGKTIDQIPGASLVYSGESNKFDLILPDKTPFEVTYIAEIDAEQGDKGWLSNEASIDGRIDTVSVDKTQTQRAEVGAGASSKLAFFLKKTDTEGNILTGAAFTIARVTSVDTTDAAAEMTDLGNGTFKYRGIVRNNIYVLTEKTTPEGYQTSDPIYIAFGTPNAELKSELEAKGISVVNANTGGGADIEKMFAVKNSIETTSITVNKIWDDNNDSFGLRPDSVTINLLADGTKVADYAVKATDIVDGTDWSYTFSDLPKYKTVKDDETGAVSLKEIEYTITESPVRDYISSVSGYTVTNTAITPAKATIEGTKVLTEGGENLAITANQFKFTIAADENNPAEVVIDKATVGVEADGSFEFKDLNFTKEGTYKFTISEVDGGEEGYIYDANTVTATIVVTKNGEGTALIAGTPTYEKANTTDSNKDKNIFINEHEISEVAFQIPVMKSISGNVPAGVAAETFNFSLSAIDGAPLPEKTTTSVTGEGICTFDAITYTEEGTYTYKVKESDGNGPYDYDTAEKTIVITVAKMNGVLAASITIGANSAGQVSITNTYAPSSASLAIPVQKTITGQTTPEDKDFTFTLIPENDDVPMPIGDNADILTITGAGTASFGTISFSETGTYKYTVVENKGTDTGYSYDTATHDVVVTVTDNNGVLVATWTLDGTDATENTNVEFINAYEPSATTIDIPISKTIAGPVRTESKTFTFTLTGENDAPVPTDNTPKTITVAADQGASGTVSFGPIQYTQAGTYTYTISEDKDNQAGFTYAPDQTVTVNVTDNGGVLNASIDTTKTTLTDGNVMFTNTYTPGATTLEIPVEKVINGNERSSDSKKDFTFKLTGKDGAPMPATDTTTIKDAGTSTFESISFEAAGTYTYEISEVAGAEHGYTYATNTYEVVVTVTDNGGNLTNTWTLDGNAGSAETPAVFVNTYTPDAVDLTVNMTKQIDGQARPTDTSFHFAMTADDENYPLPTIAENDVTVGAVADASGNAEFGPIHYTKAGTYTYTITETNDSKIGFTYDTSHKVKVLVTDTNGVLNAVWTVDDGTTDNENVVFINTYGPQAAKFAIPVKKTITGNERTDVKKTFTFTLTPENNQTPMPTSNTTTITDAGDGKFGEINYTTAGTYTYTITENAGDAHGYTYATNTHEVVVTVTDDNGELKTAWTLDGEATDENSAAEFSNNYKPDATSLIIPVEKKMEGNDRPEGAAKTFTFELKGADGNVIDTKTIEDHGGTSFNEIIYEKAGTYTYTVSEVIGDEHGYTYSTDVQTITVTVTDTDGVLSRTWSLGDEVADDNTVVSFTNNYKPDEAMISLNLVKEIIGNARPEDTSFHFTMTAQNETNPMPEESEKDVIVGKNADDVGTATFGPIAFTKAGTYIYTITETDDNAHGFTYDKAHTVTVEVSDVDGVLGATWTIDDAQEANASVVFTNEYHPDSTELAINVSKEVTGNARQQGSEKEFTFKLNPIDNAPMPESDSIKITDIGSANFGNIVYEAAGTYDYTISEEKADYTGYIFDDHIANVRVTVADTDGVLSAKWNMIDENGKVASEDNTSVVFTNQYKPTAATVIVPVEKTIAGDKPSPKSEFEFVLSGKGDEPMPEANGANVKITGEGTASFGALIFTTVGEYSYTVTEVKGSAKGYIYDETIHTIVVTVTDEDGVLKATWKLDGNDADGTAAVNFVNNFKADKSSNGGARLPQTGTLWMPIIILAGAGVVMILAGVAFRKKSFRKQK